MKLREQLQIAGLSLVLAPALALTLIYTVTMSRNVTSNVERLVEARRVLLENRLSSAWDLLYRAGLGGNAYYVEAMRRGAAQRFAESLSPGEGFALVSSEGLLLEGSWSDERGRRSAAPDGPLPAGDVLLSPVGTGGRSLRARSAVLGPGQRIVSVSSFEPLRLVIAVSADEAVALGPLRRALLLAVGLSALLLAGALLLLIAFARRVGEPLELLARTAAAMGEGRIDPRAGVVLTRSTVDEVNFLSRELDGMAKKLGGLTEGLESRVAERTADLRLANENLRSANAELATSLERQERLRGQLVQSEKLAALGQLVAGIAHELNTPLGAIDSAAYALADAFESMESVLHRAATLAPDRRKALFELARALGRTRIVERSRKAALRLGLEERFAALGLPDPGEAAEYLADAGLGPADLPPGIEGEEGQAIVESAFELATTPRSAEIVAQASRSAVRVIEALRIYARQSAEGERTVVDLAASVEGVLPLFGAKLKLGVELRRELEPGILVLAQSDKLAQVWTNLVSNALQAMDYRGRLGLSARREGGDAVVEVEDSGSGIPPEIRDRIFTPFFTTKPPGEGTGLGLEISRRIVEDSGGTISFESAPGRTRFTVRLPLAPD